MDILANLSRQVKSYTLEIGKDIQSGKKNLIDIIREGIRDIISKKIKKTGETISEFVINDYYEQFITPILLKFREKAARPKTLKHNYLNHRNNLNLSF